MPMHGAPFLCFAPSWCMISESYFAYDAQLRMRAGPANLYLFFSSKRIQLEALGRRTWQLSPIFLQALQRAEP